MSGVRFEKKGQTAYVVLQRPEARNAIDLEMRKGLVHAWTRIEEDADILSVILTGGEAVFSVGQDVAELAAFKREHPLGDMPLHSLATFGAEVTKPVIAAIGGHCLGFGFLMTMVGADIRIATPQASFGLPEIRIAVPPALGIPALVLSHFPMGLAVELLLAGKMLPAERAREVGFLNEIAEPGMLIATAEAWAERINGFSPFMVRQTKAVLRKLGQPDPRSLALSDAMCMLGRHSEDYLEGPRAFLEKRRPQWKG